MHANKLLFIGLNQVQKVLLKVKEDQAEKDNYLILILNDQETVEMNKHLIGFCRQFGFHNFLFPKFLKKNVCDIFGVKRLTSFALKVEDETLRSEITKNIKEFDNHPDNRDNLQEFKYAEETMFKTCYIKRW